MNTVSGQELVDTLNDLSTRAKKRLWIASPYVGEFNAIQRILGPETIRNFNLDFRLHVGEFNAIQRILGPETIRNFNLDFRLLVDYSECGNCNYDSMKILLKSMPGSIKSIPALHAKIYIVDNDCLRHLRQAESR